MVQKLTCLRPARHAGPVHGAQAHRVGCPGTVHGVGMGIAVAQVLAICSAVPVVVSDARVVVSDARVVVSGVPAEDPFVAGSGPSVAGSALGVVARRGVLLCGVAATCHAYSLVAMARAVDLHL